MLHSVRRKFRDPDDDSKLREDVNEIAFRVVQGATGEGPKPVPPEERTEEEKDPTAQKRGSRGGKKGGPARAKKLTPEQRKEVAEIAATARWKKRQERDDQSPDVDPDLGQSSPIP